MAVAALSHILSVATLSTGSSAGLPRSAWTDVAHKFLPDPRRETGVLSPGPTR